MRVAVGLNVPIQTCPCFSEFDIASCKLPLAMGVLHVVSRLLTRGLAWTAGLAQPGKIERGARAESCKNHLHQLHVCLPAGPGRTRLLYRMSMDFLHWTKAVPGIQAFWAHIAQQVCASVQPRPIVLSLPLIRGKFYRLPQTLLQACRLFGSRCVGRCEID